MSNWQTILSGVATCATGLVIVYFAAVLIPSEAIDSTIRGAIILAGVGMVTAGAGIAAARANATSVAAHQESLDGIAAARRKAEQDHEHNKAHIEQVKQTIPVVVEQVKDQVKAEVTQELRGRRENSR